MERGESLGGERGELRWREGRVKVERVESLGGERRESLGGERGES